MFEIFLLNAQYAVIMKKTKKCALAPAFLLCIQNVQDSFDTKVIDDLVNPGAAKMSDLIIRP